MGIFRCDLFPFEFSLVKSFRNQIAIEYLRKFVLLLFLANQRRSWWAWIALCQLATLPTGKKWQKPLCQLAIAGLVPNETGKQQKNDKSSFGSYALD